MLWIYILKSLILIRGYKLKKIECDVLVIGGGGAGLRAAVEAKMKGGVVVLIQKKEMGRSGTTAYEVAELAGYNAADGAGDPEDTPDVHFNDIIKAAQGTCDEKLVQIIVNESLESVQYLRELGIEFVTDEDGKEVITKGCFSSRFRTRMIIGHGVSISKKLAQKAIKEGVKIFENTMVVDLVITEGSCAGAIALFPSGEKVFFNSIATILATGGDCQLFEFNLNPSDVTGDGYAMGFRAGAQLTNMEFMQSGFGVVEPFYNLVGKHLWSIYPRIYNIFGEEFINKYLPLGITLEKCMEEKAYHYPFSTRDVSKYLEISVISELKKTGKYVLLDLRDAFRAKKFKDKIIERRCKITMDYFKSKGVDIYQEPLKIAVFGHAMNGGLLIDENASTTIPSLFAIGECAAGPYGADRLGGDMLLSCQVFGRRAGIAAAKLAKDSQRIHPSNEDLEKGSFMLSRFEYLGNGGGDVKELLIQLRKASSVLLINRNEKMLLKLLNEIEMIRERLFSCQFDRKRLGFAVELSNLIDSAKIIAESAIYRKESRGSHYREDYPNKNANFRRRIIIMIENGKTKVIFERDCKNKKI